MKKCFLLSLFSLMLVFSGTAQACERPEEKPEIPDPDTVVTAQMVMANNQVREYVNAMTEYINCARMSPAQQRREVRELEEFAEEFNKVVRAFRARSE